MQSLLDHQKLPRGRQVALDILAGLVSLHARNICHLDLKPSNILLTRHAAAKIGDVGLGKFIQGPGASASATAMGTWAYSAPEQLVRGRCSCNTDIWAFATVLWELCALDRAAPGRTLPRLDVPREAPAGVAQLIDECRNEDMARRPSALELYNRLLAL